MYFTPKDCFEKLSGAHELEINKDVGANRDHGVVAPDPDLDNRVMTSPERPHRPGLVPGVGRL